MGHDANHTALNLSDVELEAVAGGCGDEDYDVADDDKSDYGSGDGDTWIPVPPKFVPNIGKI